MKEHQAGPRLDAVQSTQLAMGTAIAHRAFGGRAQEAVRAAEAEVRRLESLLSRFQPASDVSNINQRAGVGSVRLSRDTYEVLSQATGWSHMCQGLFDVTIGPLVSVWQRAREGSRVPSESEVKSALALVGYSDLELDSERQSASLRRHGQSIDLGGVGKGYAGDRLLEMYRENGVESAFVNLGGNVVALGAKPDGSPWRVGIRHPRHEDALLGMVSVIGKAVVTSGDYQRFYLDCDGRRHHHVLDPSTGYPSESGLSSVTIVADSSTAADTLSTIVFVAGPEKGLALVRACPGTEAVLVDKASRVYLTPGLRNCFKAAGTVNVIVMDREESQHGRKSA